MTLKRLKTLPIILGHVRRATLAFMLSDEGDVVGLFQAEPPPVHQASDYEGLEGIYKFLEECDRSKR